VPGTARVLRVPVPVPVRARQVPSVSVASARAGPVSLMGLDPAGLRGRSNQSLWCPRPRTVAMTRAWRPSLRRRCEIWTAN